MNATGSPRRYALHGLRILSEIPLGEPVADGPHDLVVRWNTTGPGTGAPERRVLADASWDEGRGYRHVETTAGLRLAFRNVCEVLVTPDRRSLTVQQAPGADPELVPILLEGNVVATLLLLAGECVLHASAVCLGGRAVAFIGGSGTGKSTLAALCCAAGATFLTDDVLHLTAEAGAFHCASGGPEVRLRAGAASLAGCFADRPSRRTADGRLAVALRGGEAPPSWLAAVVVPVRTRSPRSRVTRLAPFDAWAALMRAPRVLGVRDPGVLRTEFETCSRLAQAVPVYRADAWAEPPSDPSLGAELLSSIGLV
ncbi:MAG TPA: hypothetical protein VH116_07115 [Gemmatimonadales bacterium]|nr:hypothetical protein [Gemmatimonadales bacterium]